MLREYLWYLHRVLKVIFDDSEALWSEKSWQKIAPKLILDDSENLTFHHFGQVFFTSKRIRVSHRKSLSTHDEGIRDILPPSNCTLVKKIMVIWHVEKKTSTETQNVEKIVPKLILEDPQNLTFHHFCQLFSFQSASESSTITFNTRWMYERKSPKIRE